MLSAATNNDRLKGHRRSPNGAGRRSPNNKGTRSPNSYVERTTTVTFVNPCTGDRYCTKLNRVEQSRAPREDGAELCVDFLNGRCEHGRSCTKVHVPSSYLWKRIEPQVDEETLTYHAGFEVQCYLPDLTRYYTIPSENLFVTDGAQHYVDLYNTDGDNFKEKCFLCPELSKTSCCQRGSACPAIHCLTGNYERFKSITTHVATAEAVTHYERMPAGFTIPVFQSNSGDAAVSFPGSDVLRTVGATRYEEELRAGTPTSGRMQHCAHFQNKKMCRLGDGCRFIHVVSVALSTPALEDNSLGSSPQRSPVIPAMDSSTADQRNLAAAAVADLIMGPKSDQFAPNAFEYSHQAPLATHISPPANGTLVQPQQPASKPSYRSPARSPVLVSIPTALSASAAPPLSLGQNSQQRSPTRRNDPYSTGS